jgi:MraZ protein
VVNSRKFRGIHALTLDNKGRVAIPNIYRSLIVSDEKASIIVSINPIKPADQCLFVFPLEHWKNFEEQVYSVSSWDAYNLQLIIGHASEVALDNQGRILIPSLLRDYARLNREVVLMGQGDRLALWDAQALAKIRQNWLESSLDKTELANSIRTLIL